MLNAGRGDARPGGQVAGQQAGGLVAEVADPQRALDDLADRLHRQGAQLGAAVGQTLADGFQRRGRVMGGQQQLVGVARAVIAHPQVLLADEPTGNLHSEQGKEIMELFRKLNEGGTTIIQVTHSEVNASYGSRVIHLRDGWIVDE